MKRFLSIIFVAAVVVGTALPLSAQQSRKSPHETISRLIENNRITIVYGRPFTQDPRTGERRKVWGTVVPFGKIWRLGADEATLLITQEALEIGNTTIPAGAYTLFMLPSAGGSALLLVNKEIGQWGIDPYVVKSEIARFPLQARPLSVAVDQFTIAIDNGTPDGGVLSFTWEFLQYSIPFRVKK